MSHVLAAVVFLGGLGFSAWLSWHGRSPDGVAALVGAVAAACVIGSAGGRGEED